VKVLVAEVIEQQNVAAGRSFVGTVIAERHSAVGSAVAGRVEKFLVNDGDFIAADKPLAQLRTRNIDIQIAAATAELQLRKHELAELKNGSRVEERQEAEARMKAAAAAMTFALAKQERIKGLIERNAATPDSIDEANSAAETATSLYKAAKAAYELVVAGPRPERIAQAQARVEAAQEEVNRLNDILDKHTIVSPFDGYVVAEHTEVGQWIESGGLVAEVVKIDPIEVRVSLPENYVTRLSLGTSARVDIDAIPSRTFVGSVTAIVPQADEKSRTFPVRIRLKNELQADGTPLLKPGMFAKVELPVDQRRQVMLVPKDALVLGGPQPVVYVVGQDAKTKKSTVQPVPVQLGVAVGSWIEVRGQLEIKQQIVIEGNERLRPGSEVIPLPGNVAPPTPSVASPKNSTNLSSQTD
jgi:multidrug efflux pump subunit AcrA (membrane-fusion protein)